MNTQIENLQEQKSAIVRNLKFNDAKKEIEQLKKIDSQIKDLKQLKLISEVNAKQTRLRELAKQVFECEKPINDILCNDSSFHAVKVKKYPKLAALKYVYGKFEDNKLIEITLNGEKFQMYKRKYEYNKPIEYINIDTFEQFLELNSIMLKNITIEEYRQIVLNCENINNEFKQAVERFSAQKNSLNLSLLNYFGLLNSHSVGSIYEFIAKN